MIDYYIINKMKRTSERDYLGAQSISNAITISK
jgi:hypothetical protein